MAGCRDFPQLERIKPLEVSSPVQVNYLLLSHPRGVREVSRSQVQHGLRQFVADDDMQSERCVFAWLR
jgi:hypothetical protein